MEDEEENFEERYEVHTLRDVIKEIRDENARTYLETRLPYHLIIHEGLESEKNLDRVHAFAKETGDYKTLSATDMKVIALGLELCEEQGELERVEKKPKELSEFRPKRFAEEYKRIEAGEEQDDSEEETDEEGDEVVEIKEIKVKLAEVKEEEDDGFT